MANIGVRGQRNLATFIIPVAMATSTSLDKQVYMTNNNTVGLAIQPSNVCIGTLVDYTPDGTYGTVDLYWPTHRGVAGGAVTGGTLLVQASGTGLLISVAGTLTGVRVAGMCVNGTVAANGIIEFIPLQYTGIVLV